MSHWWFARTASLIENHLLPDQEGEFARRGITDVAGVQIDPWPPGAYTDFADRNTALIGCSIDSQYSHKGWCASHKDLTKLKHPLLADITKRIAMDYGVLLPEKGIALRGTFIVDPKGNVRWASVNDTTVGRNVEEVLRVLDALQTEKLCPCDWKKGEKTLN